jgi:DNA-binding winged helix-turn-helix (wHTH) protein
MRSSEPSGQIVRFGVFEANLRTKELYRQGHRVRLQEQPFDVLAVLLEHAGDLVTRDQLRERVWPGSVFVDFEHGLNRAVNKLRRALGDTAENSRFVETLARRGYRFTAPVEGSTPRKGAAAGDLRVIWESQEVTLGEGDNLIGRTQDAAIPLESPSVSRRHACIRVSGDTAVLHDLGSRNGTLLNGSRLEAPRALSDGDEIRVGVVMLWFRVRAPNDAKTTSRV